MEKQMLKTGFVAIAIALMGTAAHAAGSGVPAIDRHVTTMRAGDLAGVMADYADNAVVMTPHGVAPGQKPAGQLDVFAGKTNVRKLFAVLTDKDHNPAVSSMVVQFEPRGADTTLMHWTQFPGTPKAVKGMDVFVVRGGKIVFQNVTVEPPKK
jgi:hypothetical protein